MQSRSDVVPVQPSQFPEEPADPVGFSLRPSLAVCAAAFALGGIAPAALCLAAFGLRYAARSPDRLLDLAYVAAFCGLGALVG